jgi:tRNA-binding protein
LAVVNLPVKRIASFESEVLVFRMPDDQGALVLLAPDREAPLGARIF